MDRPSRPSWAMNLPSPEEVQTQRLAYLAQLQEQEEMGLERLRQQLAQQLQHLDAQAEQHRRSFAALLEVEEAKETLTIEQEHEKEKSSLKLSAEMSRSKVEREVARHLFALEQKKWAEKVEQAGRISEQIMGACLFQNFRDTKATTVLCVQGEDELVVKDETIDQTRGDADFEDTVIRTEEVLETPVREEEPSKVAFYWYRPNLSSHVE